MGFYIEMVTEDSRVKTGNYWEERGEQDRQRTSRRNRTHVAVSVDALCVNPLTMAADLSF